MKLSDINFQELNIKEIGLWPLLLRVLVIITVCAIIVIVAYFFVVSKQLTQLETERSLNITKRKEFQEKYNLAANLSAYEQQMVAIKESYKETLKELPSSDQLAELIDNISKQAEANDLITQSIKPGEPKSVLGFYKELPITLVLRGSYNGFGSFISDISKIPRIITLHDFSVKHAGQSKKDQTNELVLELDAKTYWLSTDKPATDSNVTPIGTKPGTPTRPTPPKAGAMNDASGGM